MNEDVNGNIQALRCVVEDLTLTTPMYSVEYVEELERLSDKLSVMVVILRNYKERQAA